MIFGVLPGSVHGAMGAYIQTDLDRRIHHENIIIYSVETGEPLILFQDCSINDAAPAPRADWRQISGAQRLRPPRFWAARFTREAAKAAPRSEN